MSAIFGELLSYPQENGRPVRLYTFGDEFYARRETMDGYTAIYDEDLGLYCYAILMGGRFTSSSVPISKKPPADLRKHLKETGEVRRRKFDERYQLLRGTRVELPPGIARTLGRENGLLYGRQLNMGNVRGLTILVEFDDVQTTITRDDLDDMLNGANFTKNGNYCSVNKYYELMSSGKLNYTNDVFGPVRLPKRRSYYKNNGLMKKAIELALEQFDIDLKRYDSKDEGIIDAISFVYAGRTVYEGWLWPHNHTLENMFFDGYQAKLYTIQSAGRTPIDLTIGTFCHESGHLLCRFPDLYDYGNRDDDFEKSAGLGRFCLMSSGNHLDGGRTPAPICAYLRLLAGWYDEIVDLTKDGLIECRHGDYRKIYKYPTSLPNEYFLVENRSRIGIDEACLSDGLAVYHCDILGSNEWQGGTASRHYQVGLLQADGHLDLERNIGVGDATDLFDDRPGTALSANTAPDSRMWDGSDSGLVISNISASGQVMRFEVGEISQSDLIAREEETSVYDQPIARAEKEQKVAEFSVRKKRDIQALQIEVEGIGDAPQDLELTLIGPNEKRIPLRNLRSRGSDFSNVYDAKTTKELSELVGTSARGKWKVLATNANETSEARINRLNIKLS